MLVTERQNRLFNAQANVLSIHPLKGLSTERVPEWLEEFIQFIIDRKADFPLFRRSLFWGKWSHKMNFPQMKSFLMPSSMAMKRVTSFTAIGRSPVFE